MTNRMRVVRRGLLAVILLIVLLPSIYCGGLPLLTGQARIDFLSSHVPTRAIDRFLERVLEATVNEEYDWLATVSHSAALEDIRAAQPRITKEYKILMGDSLASLYEYRIQFTSGATVYLTLQGERPTCPDFVVTDEEVFQYIQLSSIRLEAE